MAAEGGRLGGRFRALRRTLGNVPVGLHVGIAVGLGLPLFSAVLIFADAAFLPDRFYRSSGRLRPRSARPPGCGEDAGAGPTRIGTRAGTVRFERLVAGRSGEPSPGTAVAI